MHFFATAHTIRFDDTMAYGSHHFLTAFKLQCVGRESLLFGEQVFDVEGVREALESIHLLTADAYARNLSAARLGDRLAVFVSIEARGSVSLRFCFRVLGRDGQPICAGFQTVICVPPGGDAPTPFPPALLGVMNEMSAIEEPSREQGFRDRVLAGGRAAESLFGPEVRAAARRYLSDRQPSSRVIEAEEVVQQQSEGPRGGRPRSNEDETNAEAWIFSGQGSFDAALLSNRIAACPELRAELEACAELASEGLGRDARALLGGSVADCRAAVRAAPVLDQVGIFVQNVLGARLRERAGYEPAALMGHSFGEIAAMCVAGCFGLREGVRIVCTRSLAVTKHAPEDGGLLAVGSDRLVAEDAIARLGLGQLELAGRVHGSQTIISGPHAQLERLRDHLQGAELSAVRVSSPAAFHHSSLSAVATAWLADLRALELGEPRRLLYSPIGRRRIGPGDDIAAIIVSQLLRPFDLQGALEDLVGAGVERMVDCGSSGSLERLLRAALPGAIEITRVDASAPSDPVPTPRERAAPVEPAPGRELDAQAQRPAVAIVGAGCLLPAGARSPETLWNALTEQRSGIVDLRDRDPDWEADFFAADLIPDRSNSALAGVVDDADIVCPADLDPDRFATLTRTQKLLAIALAPCRATLPKSGTILCMIGATADGFEDQDEVAALLASKLDPQGPMVRARLGLGPASRLGPHSAVQEVVDLVLGSGIRTTSFDAACASSLYTVALGTRALESGLADAVVAGGVFCPGPANSCLFSQFRGLTPNGCRPFDADADGVVFSEGAAFVVLQRRADARRAGHPILALLRGAGLSSDGRSPSANVPQTRGQLLALERCYADYEIDPASISMVEAHGTATPVGDATELTTMHQFYAARRTEPLPVHSLKGLLGHAGWAAGTASIIAACESLRRGELPAQANHRTPAEALVKAAGTLVVATTSLRLGSGRKRAAINGFGFGGADAHLVIESGDSSAVDGIETSSARTGSSLELVVVASHGLVPAHDGRAAELPHPDPSANFDREALELPKHTMLLPDLREDMDISQTLALRVVSATFDRVVGASPELRRDTSVVLAMAGKTQRSVEALTRVLEPRMRRRLGDGPAAEALSAAAAAIPASGPYTLQCMMPNVSAGRAASRLDLKGPNFVVDAGRRSLDAALESACLLLQDSRADSAVKLVVVAAIHANPHLPSAELDGARPLGEIATGIAVTTRARAAELGLEIVCELARLERAGSIARRERPPFDRYGAEGAEQLLDAIRVAATGETSRVEFEGGTSWIARPADPFPIYAPVWIETHAREAVAARCGTALVIMRDQIEQIAELLAVVDTIADRCMVAIAGSRAEAVVRELADPRVVAVDLRDEASSMASLGDLASFDAELLVAIETPPEPGFDPGLALRDLVDHGVVRELSFLLAKQRADRLDELELWALCPGAWRDLAHPVSGPLAGLLKAIQRERPRTRAAIVCTQSTDLREGLERIAAERGSDRPRELELAYTAAGARLARRLCPTRAKPDGQARVSLDANSVVVATGGARGVTAVMGEALLRGHGCTVIALGRSALEPGPVGLDDVELERSFYQSELAREPGTSPVELRRRFTAKRARWEAHATVEALRRLGGRVEYLAVDICDRAAVERVIAEVITRHGAIDLIVHGAGVQWSKRLERRSLAEFRATFDVKVLGLANLVAACQAQLGRLPLVHALTSAYSVFGNDGQHDYGAANETLDRVCELADHAGAPWSSLAWLAWDGVGMTRGSEYRALAQERGLSGIGPAHGQRLFADVLAGRTGTAINVPMTEAERSRYRVPTIAEAPRHLELAIGLAEIGCLSHHKVRGAPTLPGAWSLERMAAAASKLVGPGQTVRIEDIRFSRFVRLHAGREPNLRARVEADAEGIRVTIVGDLVHETGVLLAQDLPFCSARVCIEPERFAEQPTVNGHGPRRLVSDPYCTPGFGQVALSGPFECLHDIEIGASGRNATFDPPRAELGSGALPALLLDAAWRLSAMYAVPERDELYVPFAVGRVVAPLWPGVGGDTNSVMAAGWRINATPPVTEGETVTCPRVEVTDERGRVRLRIDASVARRLS